MIRIPLPSTGAERLEALSRSTDDRTPRDRLQIALMAHRGRPRQDSAADLGGHRQTVTRHGQVIGGTAKDGGTIKARPVTPGDLAATVYHHMGVPLDATYPDTTGRPRHGVENGRPVAELL